MVHYYIFAWILKIIRVHVWDICGGAEVLHEIPIGQVGIQGSVVHTGARGERRAPGPHWSVRLRGELHRPGCHGGGRRSQHVSHSRAGAKGQVSTTKPMTIIDEIALWYIMYVCMYMYVCI